jgi:hypothetical protein
MDTGGRISTTLKAIRAKRSKKPSRSGKIIGSRIQVYRGNATHTTGRLTKDDLIRNQHGRIVSKKRHEQGKTAIKYLEKGGYKGVLPSKRNKTLTGGSMSGGCCEVNNAEMPDKFKTGRVTGGSMSVDPDTILDK